MKTIIRIKKWNIIFSWLCIYFTSKMLWDQVPIIFEGFSLIVLVLCGALYAYSIRKKPILYLFLGICTYIVIDAFLKSNQAQIFRALYEYVLYMFFMWSMAFLYKRIDVEKCVKPIVIWGMFISILSWYEYITRTYLIFSDRTAGQIQYIGDYAFRASVFTRSFLSHGVILGIFSVLALFIFLRQKRSIWLVASLFNYISILTTSSRGPLVAFGVALVIMYWLYVKYVLKSSTPKYGLIIILILGAIIFGTLLFGGVQTNNETINYFLFRMRNIFNWTGDAGNVGRIKLWSNAIDLWKESLLLGIGPSQTGSWGNETIGVTESGILKRFVELGIFGGILIYYFIVRILLMGLKTLKHSNLGDTLIMILLICIFVGVFIDDIILQATEEIMISFWYWGALGGIYQMCSCTMIRENKFRRQKI